MYLCVYSSIHICAYAYVPCTQYLIYALCLQLNKVKDNGMHASELNPDDPCLLLHHTPENYGVCFARGQTGLSDLFLTNNI